jgi:signal transduction histidine kinase
MKLFAKYSRINFIAILPVLLIGSISYYLIIRYALINQLDDTLKVEEQEILDNVKRKGILPEPSQYRSQSVSFEEVNQPFKRKFESVSLVRHHHHENDPYRQLTFPVMVQGKIYAATVSKSQEEVEDLIGLIVLITGGVVLLLLLVLFMVNRFLLRKLWQPFYETLLSIKQFNLSNKRSLPNHNSNIDEFKELDTAMKEMAGKVLNDYDTLKNFADNASHEMQTPLAIINSKLDILIQDQNLDEKQMKQLQGIYDATGRLSKLNQSLLLLTKIENNQFSVTTAVLLDDLVKEKLYQLEDLVKAKQIDVRINARPTSIQMNDFLADILVNNLLSNAIRHNVQKGTIEITLGPGELKISNSNPPLGFNASDIFDRFQKGNLSSGSGLGLAIVRQICDNYNFTIDYGYKDNMHSFTLRF